MIHENPESKRRADFAAAEQRATERSERIAAYLIARKAIASNEFNDESADERSAEYPTYGDYLTQAESDIRSGLRKQAPMIESVWRALQNIDWQDEEGPTS